MEGRRSADKKEEESSNTEENESQEEPQKSEEEEEEDKESKLASDNEQDLNVMKLRRTKAQRSTYSLRTDRKANRGGRGKKGGVKRRRSMQTRGRKKGKEETKGSESESQESPLGYSLEDQALPIAEKFLYKPGVPWPDLTPYLQQIIEIRIAREYITPNNPQVAERQLWGNEFYTSESDIVAAMHHVGLYNIWEELPEGYEGVAVIARVTKGRNNYVTYPRYGIRSRKETNYEGHSLKPERIIMLNSLGKPEELEEMAARMPTEYPKIRHKPDLNPKAVRIIPGTHIVFDLSFEPATPYTLDNFGDKGWDETEFVSAKLKSQVLYVETETKRFELSLIVEEDDEQIFEKQDKYRWSEVNPPVMFKDSNFMKEHKVPLEESHVKVIHKSLGWSDFEWSSSSVFVKDFEYGPLKCFKYINIHN